MTRFPQLAPWLFAASLATPAWAQQPLSTIESGRLTVALPQIPMTAFVGGELVEGPHEVYRDRDWQLLVDDGEVKYWAVKGVPVLAGVHEIAVAGECFEPYSTEVHVDAYHEAVVTLDLRERTQSLVLEFEAGGFGRDGAEIYTKVSIRDPDGYGFASTYRRIAVARSGEVVQVPVCSDALLVMDRGHLARPIEPELWQTGHVAIGQGDVRPRALPGDCLNALAATCETLDSRPRSDRINVVRLDCTFRPNRPPGFVRDVIGDLNGDGVIDSRYVKQESGRVRPAALILSKDGHVCGQFAGELRLYHERLSPHSTLGHRDIFEHIDQGLVQVSRFDGTQYVYSHSVACDPHYANEERPLEPMSAACRYEELDPVEVH